ncbi:quinone-dependent dihydroorotate dehydrogenase [Candidatus Kaiserbacteria bacterium]|nr:quinone-dependent dihydroorotate dehydrogenase [Candidatus Kaiserbacteria bacterium]
MLRGFVDPVIDQLDAEAEHVAIREFLYALENSADSEKIFEKLRGNKPRVLDARLLVSLAGIELENPLMVGPGWDKVGHAVRALHELGFGAVEVGSIMERPQSGNPRPRHFNLKPGVPLNRYGFNTPGMEVVAENLSVYQDMGVPIGINIGKNKIVPEDKAPGTYAAVAKRMYALGRYFVINVSSPNTPGLRALQDKEPLNRIVQAVKAALESEGGGKPLFVKIAPDMTPEAVSDVIDVAISNQLAGIVATNTTSSGDIKAKYGEEWRNEMGGVSGDDDEFRKMSTEIIRHIHKEAGKKLTIIGVGGVKDAETALEKIRAGATAVQVVAALDTEGPTLAQKILFDLLTYLDREGIRSLKELIGMDA